MNEPTNYDLVLAVILIVIMLMMFAVCFRIDGMQAAIDDNRAKIQAIEHDTP